MEILAIAISVVALGVSFYTLYKTYLQLGSLKMTQPSVIVFTYDGVRESATPKIFFRSLLYNTASQGRVIESMYGLLKKKDQEYKFTVWGSGEREELVIGGGLFIPQNGIALNHHLIAQDIKFAYSSGVYKLKIYVVAGGKKIELFNLKIEIPSHLQETLSYRTTGVLFEWDPIEGKYFIKEEKISKEKLMQLIQ